MKYYRLSESHPRYGIKGHVIPHHQWLNIVYYDRALFDKTDESGSEYPYKVEFSKDGATPSLYYMESFADIVMLLSAAKIYENGIVQPEKNASIRVASYVITVTYRKEWDTKH